MVWLVIGVGVGAFVAGFVLGTLFFVRIVNDEGIY